MSDMGGTGGRSDDEQVERDTSYSPASEAETEERQEHPASSAATEDPEINTDAVTVLPGTGGPDDAGDVDVDDDELNLPFNPS